MEATGETGTILKIPILRKGERKNGLSDYFVKNIIRFTSSTINNRPLNIFTYLEFEIRKAVV